MSVIDRAEYIKNNISIVIQGAINKKNIHDVAAYCAHWRDILPHSEVILSISMTDCLSFEEISNENKIIKRINNNFKDDYTLAPAINIFNRICDYIIFDESTLALPLPSIKNDAKGANNINFLIESSHNGLSVVSRPYVLRIRNDTVFLNTHFIQFYCENYDRPRQEKTSVFKQRVLVPWIYTLNPYAEERLPLHISDWLNFGLTEDIKKIWDIPFYQFQDSVFYERHKREDANIFERRFNLRLAVEQYIYLKTFKNLGQPITLDYINDHRSLNLCMDLLIDNFYVGSREDFFLRINKPYQKEVNNTHKRSVCITEDAWRFIVCNRRIPYQRILQGDVDYNIKKISKNTFPLSIFSPERSPLHDQRGVFMKIIFIIYSKILSNKMKSKFMLFPEEFFKDSHFVITRAIGKYYLK